jgi:hypothetical protein
MKVAEPQILAKLQTELQQPKALAHIAKSLEKRFRGRWPPQRLAQVTTGANWSRNERSSRI